MADLLSTNTHAQRERLLDALRQRPMTTLEIRGQLDILMPATRVFELRERGFNIVTNRVVANTQHNRHKVALYALLPGDAANG